MKMTSKTTRAAFALAAVAAFGCKAAAQPGSSGAAAAAPQTEEQKTVYALGVMLGGNVAKLNLTPEELALVQKGLHDAATGKKPDVDVKVYGPRVSELARTRMAAGAQAEQARGQTFQDKAAQEQGAVRTPSGLVFLTLTPGRGPGPAATDRVKVHYTGTLIDGTEFDSSVKRGQPAEFALNQVIACWTEGVQRMKVGEKARLVCPPTIAYGERGAPPNIPGGATLVFEVELLEIKK